MSISVSTTEKSEFQRNREILKACNRVDTAAVILYLIPTFGTCLYSFFHLFIFGLEALILLTFGIFFNILVFFTGYWGFYTKKVIISAIPVILSFVSGLVCSALDSSFSELMRSIALGSVGSFNILSSFLYFGLMLLNLYNIKQFNYVSKQPGYPYFNDLVEKQKEERRQFEIKSEFEKTYERLTNNKVEKICENVYRYSTDTSKPTQMDEI